MAETFAPHHCNHHGYDLVSGFKLPYCQIYNLSEVEFKTLKAHIETNLANGFTQRWLFLAAAPILSAETKDGGWWLCVDYRAPNLGTIKNRYPQTLHLEMLYRLCRARIVTKLNLQNAYHLIQIKDGEEYITAFRTWYSQFQYWVMPFALKNAPATFQSYIDDCLPPNIDDFAVYYLDDILIYLTNEMVHRDHLWIVLQRLSEFGLYCNPEQWQFSVLEVGFLGFIINSDGIGMISDGMSPIEDWPTWKSISDEQVQLGFTNCNWRFTWKFAKLTLPLTELLKQTELTPETRPKSALKAHRKPTTQWEWTREVGLAIQTLQKVFTGALILQHFDPAKPTILQTDASGFTMAGILNQYDSFGILRPVNIHYWKCTPARQNYHRYIWELLAIVETMRQSRYYLEEANYKISIQCDHINLEYFQTSKALSRRQACWAEILSSYDIANEHLDGLKNCADGPSRWPDYEESYKGPTVRHLATVSANTVEP